MKADLYICDKSFHATSEDNETDVARNIVALNDMFKAIRKNREENTLYLQTDNFGSTIIANPNVSIYGYIDFRHKTPLRHDAVNVLMKIFKWCKRSTMSYQDMLDVLSPDFEDEYSCNGLVVMRKLEDMPDTVQVIHDKKGFYAFRRHFLKKYDYAPDYFFEEVERYYENISLNIDKQSLCDKIKEVLPTHKRIIVEMLTALDGHFINEMKENPDPINFLPSFAQMHNFDGASFGKDHHKELDCTFLIDNKETGRYCGPHLKTYKDDANNANQHMRIYFAYPKENEKKIYIGVICKHI